MLGFTASIYLLLRPHNAFAADITPPLLLRRWTAAFFASVGASQLYWLLIYYIPLEGDLFNRGLLCMAFDCIAPIPASMCTLLVLLQDRRRPQWPIFTTSALYLAYLLLLYILGVRDTAYIVLPILLIAFILGTMYVRAVRQYDRWLLDNYADLEHKEVRSSIGVLVSFMLCAFAYGLANDYFFFEVLIELTILLLIVALLWRVETMQTLETSAAHDDDEEVSAAAGPIADKINALLQQYCVDEQYYLRHDASLTQLANILSTNTHYLSQHFKQQGLTYNSYINSLRIEHFKRLYLEHTRAGLSVKASELSSQSGFRSYSTFSASFKQICGKTVKEWMDDNM